MKKITVMLALAASTVPTLAPASCGASFCTVNSNWTTQGAASEPGSLLDLRYETIDQDQLRADKRNVGVGQIARHHSEVDTVNRNLLASYSRTFDGGFGIALSVPIIDRQHHHIHNHHGHKLPQQWGFTQLGDVRVVGRLPLRQADPALGTGNAGVTVGLKLPTGKTSISNDEGDAAERSLQPGSGTTDILLGGYYQQTLAQLGASWFVQTEYRRALHEHAGYRPGAQLGLDAGVRYGLSDRLGVLLQLNGLMKRRDSGTESEPRDSGARLLSLSPGLAFAVSDSVQVYGFVELPVYRQVNGVQLTAKRALVIGASKRF